MVQLLVAIAVVAVLVAVVRAFQRSNKQQDVAWPKGDHIKLGLIGSMEEMAAAGIVPVEGTTTVYARTVFQFPNMDAGRNWQTFHARFPHRHCQYAIRFTEAWRILGSLEFFVIEPYPDRPGGSATLVSIDTKKLTQEQAQQLVQAAVLPDVVFEMYPGYQPGIGEMAEMMGINLAEGTTRWCLTLPRHKFDLPAEQVPDPAEELHYPLTALRPEEIGVHVLPEHRDQSVISVNLTQERAIEIAQMVTEDVHENVMGDTSLWVQHADTPYGKESAEQA